MRRTLRAHLLSNMSVHNTYKSVSGALLVTALASEDEAFGLSSGPKEEPDELGVKLFDF